MRKRTYLALGCLLLAGCTTQADGTQSVNKTAVGAGVGALAGGVLGNRLDKGNRTRGTIIGAAAGAAAGGGLGYMMDRQEAQLREQLASERAQHAVEIQRMRDDLLKLTLANEVSFDVNSATVKPTFKPSLAKVAEVLKSYDSQMTVVGHTDFDRLRGLQSAAVGAARPGGAGRVDPGRRPGRAAVGGGPWRERAARRQRHSGRAGAEPPGRDPGPEHCVVADEAAPPVRGRLLSRRRAMSPAAAPGQPKLSQSRKRRLPETLGEGGDVTPAQRDRLHEAGGATPAQDANPK